MLYCYSLFSSWLCLLYSLLALKWLNILEKWQRFIDLVAYFNGFWGNNNCGAFLANLLIGIHVSLTKKELGCFKTTFFLKCWVNLTKGCGWGVSLDDHGLSGTFCLKHGCFFVCFGYINVGNFISFWGENASSLSSFGFSLEDHRLLNVAGWLDVLDFIS